MMRPSTLVSHHRLMAALQATALLTLVVSVMLGVLFYLAYARMIDRERALETNPGQPSNSVQHSDRGDGGNRPNPAAGGGQQNGRNVPPTGGVPASNPNPGGTGSTPGGNQENGQNLLEINLPAVPLPPLSEPRLLNYRPLIIAFWYSRF